MADVHRLLCYTGKCVESMAQLIKTAKVRSGWVWRCGVKALVPFDLEYLTRMSIHPYERPHPQCGSRREEAYLEANRITVLTSTIVSRLGGDG